jgi:hypothetical protein
VQVNDLFIASAYGSVTFPDLPSFLQGKASTFTGVSQVGGNGFHYSRQWEGAWYAEDTIKVSPKLTLNLGLRHEFTNGWNVNPLGPVNFLFDANNVIQTQPLISNQMLTANHAKYLFAPRIGLAWDPFGHGKTVIHAGFGTYYSLLDDFTDVIPQASAFTVNNVQFPFQYVPGTPIPAGGAPRSFAVIPSDPKTPTIQEWSFLIEQQITASTALSVGYIGSHGVHLLGSGEWNPPRYVFCPASPCPASIPAGTKNYPPAPNPRLNPNRATTTDYTAFVNTSYNSLQIDLRQRLSKGLTFRANYSFSKALDDASTQLSGFFSNCSSTAMDVTNLLRDYGPSCYDIQQRFAFSGSYELPIGNGKALLGGLSGAGNKLLGGWRMNAIVTAQTGFPFTPVIGFGNSRDLGTGGAERPDQFPARSNSSIVSGVTAGCQGLAAGQQLGTPNRWFDPCAFFLPPAGTYGTLGRNTLRGPGLSELDISFFKDTRIAERMNLEFRAEFFNLLNHTNFSPPNTTVFTSSGSVSGSAGVISGLATVSRQIQFGLKLIW